MARAFGRRKLSVLGLVRLLGGVSLGALGSSCFAGSWVESRVAYAYESEKTLDTLHDYELAAPAAAARVADLEALLSQSQGDDRVLLMLARAWCRLTFGFTLDDRERALDQGDTGLSVYHLERARAGYERAMFYADQWLERHAEGFRKALSSESLSRFLADKAQGAEAAQALIWAGFARVGYAASAPAAEDRERERLIGMALLERAAALDSGLAAGTAHLGLALGELQAPRPALDRVKRELGLLDRASSSHRLMAPLIEARFLACRAHDKQRFEAALGRVIEAPDASPELRLENTIARRRARRYLTSPWVLAECFPEPVRP